MSRTGQRRITRPIEGSRTPRPPPAGLVFASVSHGPTQGPDITRTTVDSEALSRRRGNFRLAARNLAAERCGARRKDFEALIVSGTRAAPS
jgi:hypothetical protein